MEEPAVQELLLNELDLVDRKLQAVFDFRVRELGLTRARARVLFLLGRREVLNQRMLAEEIDIETPTLVRLLDGMQKHDLIERRMVDGDRRANQVVLTEHGRAMAARIESLAADLRAEFLRDIGEEDIASAIRTLRALGANISRSCANAAC